MGRRSSPKTNKSLEEEEEDLDREIRRQKLLKLTQLDQDKLKAYWDSHRNKQSEKLVDL